MGAKSSPASCWDGAWQCLCPHGLSLSQALFWDPPAREAMEYIHSLNGSCGVLVTLTHLHVLIHTAPNVSVQLWFNRTFSAHIILLSVYVEQGRKTWHRNLCRSSLPAAVPQQPLPCHHGSSPYPSGYKLDLWYLSGLIKVCLRSSIWNKKWLLDDTSCHQHQRKFNFFFVNSLPLFSTSLKALWNTWSQWTYNTDTVRVTISRDGCPSQESSQELLRGYSEAV